MGTILRFERRRTGDERFTEFCMTRFAYNGQDHSALMRNLSRHGAQFQAINGSRDIELMAGETIEFTVRTPYGPSVSTGTVKWVKRNDLGYMWGVEFVKIPREAEDPIRCLMASAL